MYMGSKERLLEGIIEENNDNQILFRQVLTGTW